MSKNIILTSTINQPELTSITYPFLERYCEEHQIDLLILRNNKEHIKSKCKSENLFKNGVDSQNIMSMLW
jgi:hypothetical protein